MQKKTYKKIYYFVDESGDPIFFDKYRVNIVGTKSSPILLLGYISTEDPLILRNQLRSLQKEIEKDDYLKSIPSWKKSIKRFHAKDDCPEIREKVFKLIKSMDFKSQFIVARKNEAIFRKRHNSNEKEFYKNLIKSLFRNRLHLSEQSLIYFEKRGTTTKQEDLDSGIKQAITEFEKKWGVKNDSEIFIQAQTPTGEPCLQIADYMNWAVQRLFIKGEDRYYKFIEEKVSLVWDIYDIDNYKNGKNVYNKKNTLEFNKISPI